MRLAIATAAALGAASLSSAALAQTIDRYGGGAGYAPPAAAPVYAAAPSTPSPYAPARRSPAPMAAGGLRSYAGMSGYGAAPRAAAAPPAVHAAGLRMLNWPGKAERARPAPVVTARYRSDAPAYTMMPQPMPRYAAMPADGRLQARPFSAPQASGAPPVQTGQAPSAATAGFAFAPPPAASRPPAPTSIYSDAPAAYPYAAAGVPATPPPPAVAASGGSRRYSVHSQYGMTPDPAPIPPQFFGPTADLSTPETPDVSVPRLASNTTAAKAAENAARLAASAVP